LRVKLTRAFAKEFAPDILEGVIEERVKDKEAKKVYDFLNGADIWGWLPPGRQQFLLNYRPWALTWLNLEWVTNVISKYNRAAACLILTSRSLQLKLENDIKEVKEKLG